MTEIEKILIDASAARRSLNVLGPETIDGILKRLSEETVSRMDFILSENARDLARMAEIMHQQDIPDLQVRPVAHQGKQGDLRPACDHLRLCARKFFLQSPCTFCAHHDQVECVCC